MLSPYRRHTKACGRKKRTDFKHCPCPIWVQGMVGTRKVRQALNLTAWTAAQKLIREWEAVGAVTGESVTVADAVAEFLADCEARKLKPGTMRRLRLLLEKHLVGWAGDNRIRFIAEFRLTDVREFRASWNGAAITAAKKLERLRGFFRFCVQSKWMTENPAADVKPPKIDAAPTLPFEEEEWQRTLAALDTYPDNKWRARLAKLFKLAKVEGGHPHRFRDTFAVGLLRAGVPLESVSILLGHSSVRVTEKHYSPWVKSRQAKLEEQVMGTWPDACRLRCEA